MAQYTAFPASMSSGSASHTAQSAGPSRSDTEESFPFNRADSTPLTERTTYADMGPRGHTDPAYRYVKTEQATEQPLALTLGVEFEMILATYIWPKKRQEPYHIQISHDGVTAVRSALQRPIEAICCACNQPHYFYLPVAIQNYLHGYGKWDVEADCSVVLTDEESLALGVNSEYFACYAIEIKTRVLSVNENLYTTPSRVNPGYTHSISYVEEIRATLAHLHSIFNAPSTDGTQPRYRLITNRKCGLHVHIGNGRLGLPLQTLKNMMSTCIACEPAIDSMMAGDRIGGCSAATAETGAGYYNPKTGALPQEGPDAAPYNSSLFALHAAATYIRREDAAKGVLPPDMYPENRFAADPEVAKAASQYSLAAAAALIQHAPDLNSIKQLAKTFQHACTVNTENLYDFQSTDAHARNAKMTVEFRQHAPTLDPAVATSWVDFLVSLTQHSHNTSREQYGALMQNEFSSLAFTAIGLLETVGARQETIAHYMLKLGSCWSVDHVVADASLAGPKTPDAYWHNKRSENALALNTIHENHPMKPLLFENCNENLRQLSRRHINERMLIKFLSGGYGQFTDRQLAGLDMRFMGAQAESALQKLRIGYKNPQRAAAQTYEPYRPYQGNANVAQPDYVSEQPALDRDMVDIAAMMHCSPESTQAVSPSGSDWCAEVETPVMGGFIPICLQR